MTDKELIKQEIESYKESMKGLEPHSDFRRGQLTAYNQIMQFINSLPEEPASEDLEEAADEYAENHGFRVPYDGSNKFYDDVDVKASKEGFIAGAAWQKQKDQETIELAEDHAMLAGMNKMKEEMMKDAVEAEVFIDYNINFGYGSLTANIDLDEQHLKEGDKVKIIIVKED